MVDWQQAAKQSEVIDKTISGKGGRPCQNPMWIIKTIFLQYLFHLNDPQLENYLTYRVTSLTELPRLQNYLAYTVTFLIESPHILIKGIVRPCCFTVDLVRQPPGNPACVLICIIPEFTHNFTKGFYRVHMIVTNQ